MRRAVKRVSKILPSLRGAAVEIEIPDASSECVKKSPIALRPFENLMVVSKVEPRAQDERLSV